MLGLGWVSSHPKNPKTRIFGWCNGGCYVIQEFFLNFFKNLTMCMTKLKVLVLTFPNFTDIFIALMSSFHISLLYLSLVHVVAIYVATNFTHMMSFFFFPCCIGTFVSCPNAMSCTCSYNLYYGYMFHDNILFFFLLLH